MIYFDDSHQIKKKEKSFSDFLSTPISMENPYELLVIITRPTFFIRDLGVTEQVLADWIENGLIPSRDMLELPWDSIGFTEYIWIRIIQKLGALGMALPMIRKVKEYLLNTIEIDWQEFTQEQILDFKNQKLIHTELSEEDKNKLIDAMSDPLTPTILKGILSFRTRLEMMVLTSLVYHREIGIRIDSDGHIWDWFGLDQNSYESAYTQTQIFISISDFIIEFISDDTKEKFLVPIKLMTKEETAVLRTIRQNDLTEVVITFPLKSGKRKLKIQTKKQEGLSKEEQDQLIEFLRLKNHQSIIVKKNDKQIYCERTHQTII